MKSRPHFSYINTPRETRGFGIKQGRLPVVEDGASYQILPLHHGESTKNSAQIGYLLIRLSQRYGLYLQHHY
jgi:hypothetical protein